MDQIAAAVHGLLQCRGCANASSVRWSANRGLTSGEESDSSFGIPNRMNALQGSFSTQSRHPPEDFILFLSRQWLQCCDEDHGCCLVGSGFFPTRLIFVGDTDSSDVKLLE